MRGLFTVSQLGIPNKRAVILPLKKPKAYHSLIGACLGTGFAPPVNTLYFDGILTWPPKTGTRARSRRRTRCRQKQKRLIIMILLGVLLIGLSVGGTIAALKFMGNKGEEGKKTNMPKKNITMNLQPLAPPMKKANRAPPFI